MPNQTEINDKINNINEDLKNLQSDKTSYANMEQKIESLISNLSTARKNMKDALDKLKVNYTGNAANRMYTDCQNVIDDISTMIKSLKHEILPEARQRIDTINAKVTKKTEKKEDLSKKLQ